MSYSLVELSELNCNQGNTSSILSVTSQNFVKIDNKLQATEEDKKTNENIFPFGVCKLTKSSCVPKVTKWENTSIFTIEDKKELLDTSICICSVGGKISVTKSAQIIASEL